MHIEKRNYQEQINLIYVNIKAISVGTNVGFFLKRPPLFFE